MKRRAFLQTSAALAGGVAFEFAFAQSATGTTAAPEVTHWVVIYPDNRVVIRVARSEMGQGSLTGLIQMVSEELECDPAKTSWEWASPNEHVKRKRIWGSMTTTGSSGIRTSHEYLRKSGAQAREMLVSAAASRWQAPVSECVAANSAVTWKDKKLTYGELAQDASKVEPPKDVKLRDPKDWKVIGKSVPRVEIMDKVTGKPIFGADVQLPKMLHASIVQCPVFKGKVKSVDDKAAAKMRGVKGVVKTDTWVAVVADNWWRANQAAKALKVEWDGGEWSKASDATIMASFREGLAAKDLPKARNMGDAPGALATAAKIVEAEYTSPYLNHCTMEPQTATAWFKEDGTLEVWASTQNGEGSIAAAAEASGLALEKVEIHKMMLGGGFGRRGAGQDYVTQAVTIAKDFRGTPVKLLWSREEDMQHGFYRPASLVKMRAGLDAGGNMVAMHTVIACPSVLTQFRHEAVEKGIDSISVRTFHDSPYTTPNQLVEYALKQGHVPVGFWRAPGLQNSYYRECFIDEVAHAAGKDPLEFRLAMLKDGDRNKRVLEAVAKAAGWGTPPPAGQYRGIAQADGFGSYTAMVADVSVKDGRIKVHRVVGAIDSGYVVNPDMCVAQMQGNVIFNIGQLYEANTVKDGRIVESNFHDFKLPTLPEMPKVEVVLASTGGFWGGHGEPGALCVVPAILNAVFAATGKRVRTLPLKDGVVA